MRCQYCDTEIPDAGAFCPNCGARAPENPASSAGKPTTNLPTVTPSATFDLPPAQAAAPPAKVPPAAVVNPVAPPYIPQGTLPPAVAIDIVPNSNTAIVSLIFGIISWFLLPVIGAIVAVVAGHMARKEIRESGGRIGGSGMATAGLILGYLHFAALVVVSCIIIALLALGVWAIGTSGG